MECLNEDLCELPLYNFYRFKKEGKEFVIFLGFENGKGELVKVYYEQRCQVCDRVVC